MRAVIGEKQRRRTIAAVAAIVAVTLVVSAVLFLTSSIDRKLNESAEQQVITFTEQAAANVSDRMFMVQNAIGSFTLQSSDPDKAVPALRALMGQLDFANVAFVDMSGKGREADGAPFSIEQLDLPEVALA